MAEIGGLNLKFTSDTTGFAKGSEKVKQGLQSVDDKAKNSKGLSKWAEKAATAAKLLAGPAALGGVVLALDKVSGAVESAARTSADFFNEITTETRGVLLPTLENIVAQQKLQEASQARLAASMAPIALHWERVKTSVWQTLAGTIDLEEAQRKSIEAVIDTVAVMKQAEKNVPSMGEGFFDVFNRADKVKEEYDRLFNIAVKQETKVAQGQVDAYAEIHRLGREKQLFALERFWMTRDERGKKRNEMALREIQANWVLAYGDNNKEQLAIILAATKKQHEHQLDLEKKAIIEKNAAWTSDYTGPGSEAWVKNYIKSTQKLAGIDKRTEMERIEFANTLAEDEWAGYGSPQFNARMLREREGLQEALSEQEKLSSESRVSATSTMFGNLATLTQAGSKKLFKIGKVAAISEALINAYKGISETWNAYPYPWNIPMAAAHATAAFAQVRSIASTQYGSTSAGGGVVGGAGGNAAAAISTPAASINVVGSEGATFSRDQIIGLIGQLNEAVGDGAQLSATAA